MWKSCTRMATHWVLARRWARRTSSPTSADRSPDVELIWPARALTDGRQNISLSQSTVRSLLPNDVRRRKKSRTTAARFTAQRRSSWGRSRQITGCEVISICQRTHTRRLREGEGSFKHHVIVFVERKLKVRTSKAESHKKGFSFWFFVIFVIFH